MNRGREFELWNRGCIDVDQADRLGDHAAVRTAEADHAAVPDRRLGQRQPLPYPLAVDVQRNGHVLIPKMDENRVVEYDGEGRVVRQLTVSQPIAAVRLPNGNTLVTSMDLNRAIELDPKSSMAYLSHGVGNYYLPQAFGGGIDLAIKDFRKAIELNPKNADAWLWLGVALRRSNQPAEAQKAFEQSLQINPNRAWARQQLEKTPGS